MNGTAGKIQIVINTIQALEIRATYENMNHLMGALKLLAEIRDGMNAGQEADEHGNGNTDAE